MDFLTQKSSFNQKFRFQHNIQSITFEHDDLIYFSLFHFTNGACENAYVCEHVFLLHNFGMQSTMGNKKVFFDKGYPTPLISKITYHLQCYVKISTKFHACCVHLTLQLGKRSRQVGQFPFKRVSYFVSTAPNQG